MEYQIAMLWMRGNLSFLEQLCIQSFLDAGHSVILYSYDKIGSVPDCVECRDANAVCTEDGGLTIGGAAISSPMSDRFRYRLLAEIPDLIWAETDVYCVNQLSPMDGHLHGWDEERNIGSGILALPCDSPALRSLVEFTSDPYAVPPFLDRLSESQKSAFEKSKASGVRLHVAEQPLGVWGTHALTHFLTDSGEAEFARSCEILYPLAQAKCDEILSPDYDNSDASLSVETLSIRLHGQHIRKTIAHDFAGCPHPESYLGRLLRKHRIDPSAAPLHDGPRIASGDLNARRYREVARGADQDLSPTDGPTPLRPLDQVVAITTMRNEGAFILDWIAYHRTLGITHFLVYTNDCDDATDAILHALERRGFVTRVDNPVTEGEKPQRVALEAAQHHSRVVEADAWVVMDVDEYINIHVGDGMLEDLFAAAHDPDMLSMTWRLFGASNRIDYNDFPVPVQFTRAAPRNTNKPHHAWGMKTICRRVIPFAKLGVHRPLEPTGGMPRWTNGSGQQMPDTYLEGGWRSSKGSVGYDLVTLNHYAVRSAESFLVKRDRGRTNHISRPQGIEYWDVFNRNDEEDLSIRANWDRATVLREVFASDPELAKLHQAAVDWHRARIDVLKTNPKEAELFALITASIDSTEQSIVEIPDIKPVVSVPDTTIPSVAPAGTAIPLRAERPPIGDTAEDAFRNLMERVQSRQRMLVRPDAIPPSERVVVVTSMKNEGCFILEWIAYHLSIGVTHFLVYTNDCDDPTNAVLDQLAVLGHVTRRENPYNREAGQKPQRGALNDAATRPEVTTADWVGVIDCDEFVNIHVGDGTFAALLEAANHPNVISMTWRTFGNKGIHHYDDTWQTETLTACAPEYLPKPRLGWGFKSFFRTNSPFAKIGVHRPLHLDEARVDEIRWVNGAGRVMPDRVALKNEWFSRKDTIGYDMVTLNHYVLRSAESFLVKRQRGRINHVDQDQGIAYWASRNYATETDTRILTHLPRAKAVLDQLLSDSTLANLHAQAVDWHRNRIAALLETPEYRTLFNAITNPELADAIWRARPEDVERVEAAE